MKELDEAIKNIRASEGTTWRDLVDAEKERAATKQLIAFAIGVSDQITLSMNQVATY